MRPILVIVAALALVTLPLTAPLAAALPAGGVIHVSASAPEGGDGSSDHPYNTIAGAVEAAAAGSTIEVADGTYREGELSVTKGLTIRAAEGAKPVLTGAEVPTSWSRSGSTWATASDMVRFCTVCTTNADPSVEGMAAHPEQVFVDGQPLTQVGSRDEVADSTFYVEDNDPITLKDPSNNRAGYNAKPHRGTSYVIGVDPAAHNVEVVQHSRAMTLNADDITLDGLTVEKYSPVQEWNYSDPEIGGNTGGLMLFGAGKNLTITNNSFRYSGAGTAVGITDASNATFSGNQITDNAGTGAGINRSSGVTVENNSWSGNNTAGFNTNSCSAYCTISDMKITHSEKVRYAYNTVDYSAAGVDHADVSSWSTNRQSAVWFDEGVLDSQIVGSHFVNVPVGAFVEVSRGNIVASNVVDGAGVGVLVGGSEDTQIWNNTITHALTSISVYEDERAGGCNALGGDGGCALPEDWSAEHGLTWDATGTNIYNNILSSEEMLDSGDVWRYSAMLQVTGAANADGSGAVYANDMVAGIDSNVYYRQPTSQPSTTVLWQYGADRSKQSVNAASLSDFTNDPNVTVAGKEANGLDLQGGRADNPVLTNEAPDPTAWGTSDLHVAPDGPAAGTGTTLPQDVADALGVDAGGSVDRGALVNAAWNGGGGKAPTPPGGDVSPAPADPGNGSTSAPDTSAGDASTGGGASTGGDAADPSDSSSSTDTSNDGSSSSGNGASSSNGGSSTAVAAGDVPADGTGGSHGTDSDVLAAPGVDATPVAAPEGQFQDGSSGNGSAGASARHNVLGWSAAAAGALVLGAGLAFVRRRKVLAGRAAHRL